MPRSGSSARLPRAPNQSCGVSPTCRNRVRRARRPRGRRLARVRSRQRAPWDFGPRARAAVTALSQVGALAGGVLCGLYSDRLGRRRTIGLALAGAVLMIPIWAFAPVTPLLVLGAFAMQFFVQGAWGVIPAHINELAPDGVRGFLPGFAYQCGVAIASQIPHVH